jgi:hypothetical protein
MSKIIDRLKVSCESDSHDPCTRSLLADATKHIQGLERLLASQSEKEPNSPIKELIAEYRSEYCDFSDLTSVSNTSLHYVSRMGDSHVRCLLYTLAMQHITFPNDH